jgi:tRNA dimethylallyltransferase
MSELIVLVGQTASGKSDLAVELAHALGNTIIVSIDSRQIYKKLDLSSGKVEGQWVTGSSLSQYSAEMMCALYAEFGRVFVYRDIPHFLIDFVDPSTVFTLNDFLVYWAHLCARLPSSVQYIIAVGGTGLYAKALRDKYPIAAVDARLQTLRNGYQKRLTLLPVPALQGIYARLDCPALNESDHANSRRLVSAIMRHTFAGEPVDNPLIHPVFSRTTVVEKVVDSLEGAAQIQSRLERRIAQGMVEEVVASGLPLSRLMRLGLEQRMIGMYLHGLIPEPDWQMLLTTQTIQYARRQRIWNRTQLSAIPVKSVQDIVQVLK